MATSRRSTSPPHRRSSTARTRPWASSAQVVVHLLARQAHARRERCGRAGLGELGQEPGPHRIEGHHRGRRIVDHFEVDHGPIGPLTRLVVNGQERLSTADRRLPRTLEEALELEAMAHGVDDRVLEQVLDAHEVAPAGAMDLRLELLGRDLGEVPSIGGQHVAGELSARPMASPGPGRRPRRSPDGPPIRRSGSGSRVRRRARGRPGARGSRSSRRRGPRARGGRRRRSGPRSRETRASRARGVPPGCRRPGCGRAWITSWSLVSDFRRRIAKRPPHRNAPSGGARSASRASRRRPARAGNRRRARRDRRTRSGPPR